MGTHPIFESDFDCLTAMVVDKYEQYFKDHNRTKEFSGHSAKVHTVAWSCDGKRLASGSLDKTACVFTLDKDRLVKETSYKGHGDYFFLTMGLGTLQVMSYPEVAKIDEL